MPILLVGLNHKSAPIEVRERFSFPPHNLLNALSLLNQREGIEESLILSTCNRVEIYARVPNAREGFESIERFISDFHRLEPDYFKKYLYSFCDMDALKHLFRVASSLDSMVVGETQIFGQVRDAYLKAKEAKCAKEALGKIFAQAIRIGKKVRSQTQIGKGAVSVSSAALVLAKKIFGSLKDKKVLIIGAGKIAELAVKNLYPQGIQTVLVANRTFAKAKELAYLFGGTAIKFKEIFQYLDSADILISSTSAPHFLLTYAQIEEAMQSRNHRPLFLIDLGLPRNISPEVNEVENIHLYNLDDLTSVCGANLKERLCEAEKAEKIIDRHLAETAEELLQFKSETLTHSGV